MYNQEIDNTALYGALNQETVNPEKQVNHMKAFQNDIAEDLFSILLEHVELMI